MTSLLLLPVFHVASEGGVQLQEGRVQCSKSTVSIERAELQSSPGRWDHTVTSGSREPRPVLALGTKV